MEWYWIVLLILSGVGIGLFLAYLFFMWVFKDLWR